VLNALDPVESTGAIPPMKKPGMRRAFS